MYHKMMKLSHLYAWPLYVLTLQPHRSWFEYIYCSVTYSIRYGLVVPLLSSSPPNYLQTHTQWRSKYMLVDLTWLSPLPGITALLVTRKVLLSTIRIVIIVTFWETTTSENLFITKGQVACQTQ